jgi:methyl-accepting chemotaxis protein
MSISLKKKLVITFVLAGFVPMAAINFVSYTKARAELEKAYFSKLDTLGDSRASEIAAYFDQQKKLVEGFAKNPLVVESVRRMTRSFYTIESDAKSDASKVAGSVEGYYKGDFAKAYKEKSAGGAAEPSSLYASLDAPARWAQYAFISENPSALGSKHEMISSPVRSTYAKDHEEFHPYFKGELERYGFYDIFLVTPDAGRVVYTVFKELDYGTSLTKGPYASSGLANAFQAAKKLKDGESWFEDYALYTPSYDAPASFLSAPVYDKGDLVGVFIVQIPLDRISGILASRVGMGEGGETYLAGIDDGLLRSDTFRAKDTYNVVNAFRDPKKYALNSPALAKVRGGQHDVELSTAYDGRSVLSAVNPIEVLGRKWALFVEIPEEEALVGVIGLNRLLLSILSFATIALGFLAWWMASSLSRRLVGLAQGLGKSSDELASASTRIASTSTELSEASTEQAASLQETVASVEEISAMVNQNAEAASKSREASGHSRREAEEGRKNVGDMMDAISQIKSSNEEILQQMESGNKEIGDIVKVIGEIGEKTKVINDIVFQTKLLSFNASVEAARAGEHGKGFAVVAEEVGNLAQMSGDAAKEISSMLSASMHKVEAIVERTTKKVDVLVELGRDKVAQGQSTAQKCRDSLERILTQVASVNDMVTEISNASREQAQGIQEITKAVNQLDQVTQQNTMASQDSSSQAESLSHQATDLNTLVEELLVFVEGVAKGSEPKKGAPTHKKKSEPHRNVVSLEARKQEKSRAPNLVEKKVVGLRDPEVPSSDDPRFEDF